MMSQSAPDELPVSGRPAFRLRLFGSPSIEAPDGAVLRGPVAQRHRLALLALLARSPRRGLSREALMGYLWPERGTEQARQLLKQAVYQLRRALGDGALASDAHELRLDVERVGADVVEFEAVREAGDHARAVALYAGPFLDGFFLSDAPEFERWAGQERERLAAAYAMALETLAGAAESAGDIGRAVELWKARAAHDPLDSRVVLRLMQAQEASGNRAGALRSATLHQRLLRSDLGTEPAPELLAWAERLRRTRTVEPQSAPPPVSASTSGQMRAVSLTSAVVEDAPPAPPHANATVRADPAPPETPLAPVASPPHTPRSEPLAVRGERRVRWGGWVAAATAVLALLAAVWWRLAPGTPARAGAGARTRVVVADFMDRTRHATYGDLVAHVVRSELARSPALSVVGSPTIADALRRMRRSPDARVTADLAREVAAREQIGVVVEGEVRPAGAGLVITVSVVETATGDVIAGAAETARDSTQLLAAIGRLSDAVRRGVGESVGSIRATDSLFRFTTVSLAALRKHMAGSRAYLRGDAAAAADLLEEAITFDPDFAYAHLLHWAALGSAGVPRSRALPPLMRAYALRRRLTDRERYAVEGNYHLTVTGDLPRAVAAFRNHVEALERYPAGEAGWYAAAGLALTLSGDLAAAQRVLGEARTRFPTLGNQVVHAGVLHAVGADDRASQVLDEQAGRFPEHPAVLGARAGQLAASGHFDDAHAVAARAPRGARARVPRFPHDPAVPSGLWLQAALDAVRGRVGEAADHLQEVRDAAIARGDIAGAVEVAAAIGRLRHLAGDPHATADVDALLRRHPLDSLDLLDRPYLPLALFYADAGGRPRRARALLDAYERDVPREFRGPDGWMLHRARAAVRRAEGDPATALAELREASRLPALRVGLSDDPFLRAGDHPELARVHEAVGAADSAIAVYERYLAVRSLTRAGIDAFELGTALERLGVLYARRGDRARAAASYRRVAALWGAGDAALQRRAVAAGRRAEVLGEPLAR